MTSPVLHIPRLATVGHVADLLSLHPRTVRDLYTDGTLTVYRVGPKRRSIRIDLASVEAYLCRHRVAVPQPVSPSPPTSEASISTAAARSGTRAAASSAERANPSTLATPQRPANDCAPSSRAGAQSSTDGPPQTAEELRAWIAQRRRSRRQ